MIFLYVLAIGIGATTIIVLYQLIFTSKVVGWKKMLLLIVLTLVLILASFVRLQFINNDSLEAKVLGPIASPIQKGVEALKAKPSKKLENIILPLIENEKGDYSVVIKNLKTDEYYFYNQDDKLQTASLYKLWVMGATYEEIEKGALSPEKQIGFDAQTINERLDIASESAEFTEGFIGNTVEGALERMITISDNYSAHILYLTIGWNKVGNFIKKYQLSKSSTEQPITTTANDLLKYFELLYKGKMVTKKASNEMLEILKRQTWNDRIPKYLPDNVKIAHKTGELFGVKHDAGIVFSPKGDYIIVLMSDTPSQTRAAEVEAKISEAVWEYFQNN